MRRITGVLVLACAVSLGVGAAFARAEPGLVFGVNDDVAFRYHYADNAKWLAQLPGAQVGVWTRPDDHSAWSIPRSRGVLLQLVGTPYWVARPRLYAAEARRLVLEHPNIREIQVWNEPDLCWFPCAPDGGPGFRFRDGYVDSYLNLLAATHDALAGTGVKVLGFGFSPRINSKWTPEDIAHRIRDWYNRRGGRTWKGVGQENGDWISVRFKGHPYRRPIMDGFAYHPYCVWDRWTTERVYNELDELEMPGGTPELWWTETGFDTEARGFGYFGASSGIGRCAHGTEAEQATRVLDVFREARESPHVAGAFNFLLRDERDLSRWQSGLVRPDGSAKPALQAFVAAVR